MSDHRVTFGYTITYVDNVEANLTFFQDAFGFERKFLHPSGDYGELATGQTTLAFASHGLGETNFKTAYRRVEEGETPLGIELGFVTKDVEAVHQRALKHGAKEISAPKTKPWGQIVSYVTSPSGLLIEICTPIGG